MKNIISHILRTGHSNTKKPLADIVRYLYPLRYILRDDGPLRIQCNDNPFWDKENEQNLIDLLHDVHQMCGHSMRHGSYYHIINRFEHGDGYGIAREGVASYEVVGTSDAFPDPKDVYAIWDYSKGVDGDYYTVPDGPFDERILTFPTLKKAVDALATIRLKGHCE